MSAPNLQKVSGSKKLTGVWQGEISAHVGSVEIAFESLPVGPSGRTVVSYRRKGGEIQSREVAWKRIGSQLWLELEDRLVGFDLIRNVDDDGASVFALRGLEKGGSVAGLKWTRAGQAASALSSGAKKRSLKIKAQMPGKVVRVHVKKGDEVQPGQSLLVLEAMKMENEIRASAVGKVVEVHVKEGEAVETGAALVLID